MPTECPSTTAHDVQHADNTDVVGTIEPEAPPTHGAPTAASQQADELLGVAILQPNDRQRGNDAETLTIYFGSTVNCQCSVQSVHVHVLVLDLYCQLEYP